MTTTDGQGRFSFPAEAKRMEFVRVMVRRDRGSDFGGYMTPEGETLFVTRFGQTVGDPLELEVPKVQN
jgi:hypothetical protein